MVNPPEGFVADHNRLSDEVTNEVEALQFTITDVGSRYVPTHVMYKIKHKGRSQIVRSKIGISLAPEFVKAKGLDIAKLKAQGVHFSERLPSKSHQHRESVQDTIANQEKWSDEYKVNIVNAYTSFLGMEALTWEPPRYKRRENCLGARLYRAGFEKADEIDGVHTYRKRK